MFGYMDLGVVVDGPVGASSTVWGDWICGLEWVRRILLAGFLSTNAGDAVLQVKFSDGTECGNVGIAAINSTPIMYEYLGALGTAFRLGVTNAAAQAGTCRLVAQLFM